MQLFRSPFALSFSFMQVFMQGRGDALSQLAFL
jgi:hypothetical protein